MSGLNSQKQYSDEDLANMRSMLIDIQEEDEELAELDIEKLTDEELIEMYENRFGVHGDEYDESEDFSDEVAEDVLERVDANSNIISDDSDETVADTEESSDVINIDL